MARPCQEHDLPLRTGQRVELNMGEHAPGGWQPGTVSDVCDHEAVIVIDHPGYLPIIVPRTEWTRVVRPRADGADG